MFRRVVLLVAVGLAVGSPVVARTARDLSARIHVDGFTTDWADSEWVFGYNPTAQALEEALDDSKWGSNNDINQIRITWDANYLYLAGEGRIWANNMILWIDSLPGQGLSGMNNLTSWQRNFFFDDSAVFHPDLFAATWDQNLSPRLIVNLDRREGDKDKVDDEIVGTNFTAVATFDQGNTGRAMEVRIPWRSVYLGQANGPGVRDTTLTVGGITESFPRIPRGAKLLIAGCVTGGGDGTGGPDLAPDGTDELSDQSGVAVNVSNWAVVSLDENDDTGMGHGGPDGIPDWNVTPRARVTFRYPPPIFGVRNCLRKDFEIDRPAFRPDMNERVHFKVELNPKPDPNDVINKFRGISLTANVFDARGRFVRNLYVSQNRLVLAPALPYLDVWDGRDELGQIVRPGVYIIRLAIEKNICRATRAVVVVR